jgi:hypothetical protein
MLISKLAFPALLLTLVLANLVLYSGVFQGEEAVSSASKTAPPTPAAGASTSPARSPVAKTAGAAELAAERAERDDSDRLPGRWVPSQGRQHTEAYPLPHAIPFCAPDEVSTDCYASNPPTSGMHLPVQGTVLLEGGHRLKIPPDFGIYDFAVPREAIPHIEEHAGVYLGYRCESDDCNATVERVKDLVDQEISLGARVVMSPDPDLEPDTIALASWTRVDAFSASDYSDERVRGFIKAHSCRFDPERFCTSTQIN